MSMVSLPGATYNRVVSVNYTCGAGQPGYAAGPR